MSKMHWLPLIALSCFLLDIAVADSTNRITIVTNVSRSSLGLVNTEVRQICDDAFSDLGSRSFKVRSAELLAWSLYVDRSAVLPAYGEHAVVLVNGTNQSTTNFWGLACVSRSIRRSPVKWRLDLSPPLGFFQEFPREPTDSEISLFFRSANFGHRTYHLPHQTVAVDVVLYRNSSEIIGVLCTELPIEEKQKRFREYRDTFMEPMDRQANRLREYLRGIDK